MARERAENEPQQPPAPPMSAQERKDLDDRLARIVTKPIRSALGGGGFFLLWSARDDAGMPQTMIWNPETQQELRDAHLFYDAAHGLGAFARPVRAGEPMRRSAEHAAFIAGILANRDDDTGYLAYADYLTEHGHSQGDYIRLCIELAKLPPEGPEAEEVNRRMNELSAAHAEEWFASLGELGLRPEFFGSFTPWAWMSYRHGVIEEVTIDRPGVLPENADRLFAAAPFLRKLQFEQGHLDPAGLAKVEQLAQIDELDLFRTDLTADGLRALLASKHLTALKTLNVSGNQIGDAGAAALAAWPGLGRLDALDVSSCGLQHEGVRLLAAAPAVANLKRLRIGRNGEAGVPGLLLGSPHLKNLRELELGGMEFTAGTAADFQRSAFAKTLTHLDFDCATFQPGGFEAFTRCDLPALRSLKLNGVELGASEGAMLAVAAFARTLAELYLDVCRLGSAGTEALAAGTFPQLTKLELSRNRIGDRGAVALANAAKNFPALTNLRLWNNDIGAEGVRRLADSELLANVTDLDLNANDITTAGAVALADSTHLTKLRTLIVDEKPVGEKGKQALLDRFGEGVVSFR